MDQVRTEAGQVLELRPARDDDSAALVALAAVIDRSLIEEQLLHQHLRATGGLDLVAIWAERAVAHLVVSGPGDIRPGEVAIAVENDWREMGLGSALMNVAIEWAPTAGVERIWLEVAEDNEAARALYQGAGFVEGAAEDGRIRAELRLPA